jgi:hypothetical protein
MDATTGALIVAALSVLMTPITAWLTFRWGREQERERLTSERAADEARWQREERTRRVVRGEEAAGRLLELVDEATTNFKDDQGALYPTYIEMRRRAELLTDDAARDRLFQVADALYYAHQSMEAEPRLTSFRIGSTAANSAHAVIRAYLHQRPMPDLQRFDRLRALKDKGGQMIYKSLGDEDLFDPLADPNEAEDDEE